MKAFWTVLVVCIAAYSGFWYVQAEKLEKACSKELADFQYAAITYDAIQKRGFPFSLQLVFTNPKVKNEAVSYELEGVLTGRWSLFGEFKNIDVIGKSLFALPVSEEDKISLYHLEGCTVAEVDSFTKGVLNISNARLHSPENEDIGPIDWTFKQISARYDLKSPQTDRAVYNLDVDIKGANYQVPDPAQEVTVSDFYNVFMRTMAEKSGNTNYSFKLECDLPSKGKIEQLKDSPLLLLSQSLPKVSIELKSFTAQNALGLDEVKGAIFLHEDDQKNIVLHIDSSGFIRYFARYYEALLESIDKMSMLATRWDAPKNLSPIKSFLVNHADTLKSLIPHPDALGKIQLSQSASIVLNKGTFNWHMALENLSISCDQYALSVQADAQERNNSTRFELSVKLKNAPSLVEDIQNFYNRLEGVVNLFEDQTQAHLKPLPDSAKTTILGFIQSLATPNSTSDELEIIVSYHDGKIFIGPLTLEEARAEAEAIWTAIMNPQPDKK